MCVWEQEREREREEMNKGRKEGRKGVYMFLCLCVYMWGCVYKGLNTTCKNLVLTYYHLKPGAQTQIIRPSSKDCSVTPSALNSLS